MFWDRKLSQFYQQKNGILLVSNVNIQKTYFFINQFETERSTCHIIDIFNENRRAINDHGDLFQIVCML